MGELFGTPLRRRLLHPALAGSLLQPAANAARSTDAPRARRRDL